MKNLDEMSTSAGVPLGFQGCHLIKLDGYVFEGHITSDIIKRFLSEHPKDLVGLSIPGMPGGVPGMEGIQGGSNQGLRDQEGWDDFDLRGAIGSVTRDDRRR